METDVTTIMQEELVAQIQDITNLETGSAEKNAAIEGFSKLYETQKAEEERQRKAKAEKIDRNLTYAFRAGEFALVLAFDAVFLYVGMDVERTDHLCSQVFRTLWSRFKLPSLK